MSKGAGGWFEPASLVEAIRELGHKASWSAEDGDVVEFEAVGFRCHVVPYPPNDLQLAIGFLQPDDSSGFDLVTVNQLNLHHRFAKLVIDPDGDLLVLMDIAFAQIEATSTIELLRDCLDTWVEVVSEVVVSLDQVFSPGDAKDREGPVR